MSIFVSCDYFFVFTCAIFFLSFFKVKLKIVFFFERLSYNGRWLSAPVQTWDHLFEFHFFLRVKLYLEISCWKLLGGLALCESEVEISTWNLHLEVASFYISERIHFLHFSPWKYLFKVNISNWWYWLVLKAYYIWKVWRCERSNAQLSE